VAINGAENAALLAIHIMALKYDVLKDKLREYRKQMAAEVEAKDKALKY
jgi:5-(carboxyamino)imidazole ribonucleotide mutase